MNNPKSNPKKNPMTRRDAVARALLIAASLASAPALAQTCPGPLADAKRLVLVAADGFNAPAATLQTFERATPKDSWKAIGAAEPALVGKAGMAWSHFFRDLRRGNEPVKVEGDKRAPAGVYRIGRTFGIVPSPRPGHLQVTGDTICVHDLSSPAYNTIASRAQIGPKVSAENMSRALPMYRRGLLVDYPTDAKARAGSCIFIHVWHSPTTGTAGCVSMQEVRLEALQEFAAPGAVLAIMPRAVLPRLAGCLPAVGAGTSKR
jgi:L,D-peptidoglycan transpeptidase YkuD (ErfK/YbiS/YcfS/YnhG family)